MGTVFAQIFFQKKKAVIRFMFHRLLGLINDLIQSILQAKDI